MIGVLDQNIGDNFGVFRIFDADVVRGERQENVAGVEYGAGFYVFGNGAVGEAHAVYLNGQLHRNISGAQVASRVQHGPATGTVSSHDDAWRVEQFRVGEGSSVRGKMLEYPGQAVGSEKRSEGGGADVLKAGTAEDVADLHNAGGFVVARLE